MQEKPDVEDLIADSMTLIFTRAKKLPKEDKLALVQEFREWLNERCKVEDVLILDTRIK